MTFVNTCKEKKRAEKENAVRVVMKNWLAVVDVVAVEVVVGMMVWMVEVENGDVSIRGSNVEISHWTSIFFSLFIYFFLVFILKQPKDIDSLKMLRSAFLITIGGDMSD